MTKVKMVLTWCIPMFLITVALMTPVISQAGAASIKIWPYQLTPQMPWEGSSPEGYYQSHFEVRNGVFFAPLKLPLGVGAKITKVTYYHLGYPGGTTAVYIIRVKMGPGMEPQDVASGGSTDVTGDIIPVVLDLSVGDPILRLGYQYYVHVESNNHFSSILGVQINYYVP
jgi:hypothetical protein